jgi:myo-inositol-1(or 4)-monophosphatase
LLEAARMKAMRNEGDAVKDSELSLIERAVIYATEAHAGKLRKGTNFPYILHPLETSVIVAAMTDDENVIAAALLHDVVEDAKVSVDEIERLFGAAVAELVASESEDKREDRPAADTWKIRKTETLEKLAGESREAKMIALGDKLSNMRATSRDYKIQGGKFWQRFNEKDPERHAWYYRSMAEALAELSDCLAYREYAALVKEIFG